MQEVRILVPEASVAQFYRWFSDWLEGRESSPAARTSEHVEHREIVDQPAEGLHASAIAWWKSLKKLEREIFSLWIEAAPGHVSADEIVKQLGLQNTRVIPGSLSWTNRRAKAAGFPLAWSFYYDAENVPMYGLRDVPDLGMSAVEYGELIASARASVEQSQSQ